MNRTWPPCTKYIENFKIIHIENMKRLKIYHQILKFSYNALKNDFVFLKKSFVSTSLMVMLKVIRSTPAPSLIIFVTDPQYDVKMVGFTATTLFCTTETEIAAEKLFSGLAPSNVPSKVASEEV